MSNMLKMNLLVIPCVIAAMSAAAFAADTKGSVNWNEGYVEALGEGTVNPSGNKSKDKMNARRAAEVKAQRALLETIKGVHVTSATTVQDSMLTEDIIKTKVEGVVKGAQIIESKVEVESDGSISATVIMRACLMGGNSCKGKTVVQALELEKKPEPAFVPLRTIFQEAPAVAPPPAPVAVEPLPSPVAEAPRAPAPRKSTYVCDLTKPVTGLVFTLDGKTFEKVLMPVVISEGGSDQPVKVYSAMLVKPAVFRTFGAIRYADSVDTAVKQSHVNGNALVVSVKEITKDNMIVISSRDLATIKETLAHGNNYIEEAKVVISTH